jgi:hypothetical protein
MGFIENLILSALWIWGVYCLFEPGMLLARAGAWIQLWIGVKWCKPLFLCPQCMASIHGTICFFAMPYLTGHVMPFPALPIFCVCLCGLNFIINNLIPE